MDSKILRAIDNNIDLCSAILASQNISSSVSADVWFCNEPTLPYYPNIITRSPSWIPDGTFKAISEVLRDRPNESWGIKDSFAVLHLEGVGFAKAFDAFWFQITALDFQPSDSCGLRYEAINSERDLFLWCRAWDNDEELGKKIFGAQLLSNPNFKFVAGYSGEKIVSGCIFSRSQDVWGISNVFFTGAARPNWSGLISHFFDTQGRVDLVGYEKEEQATELQLIGSQIIGPLSVWISGDPHK